MRMSLHTHTRNELTNQQKHFYIDNLSVDLRETKQKPFESEFTTYGP